MYKDAHNRRIRRQMVEAQLSSELEQVRSSTKISSRSGAMAFTKLQRDVADIYEQVSAAIVGIAIVSRGTWPTSTSR